MTYTNWAQIKESTSFDREEKPQAILTNGSAKGALRTRKGVELDLSDLLPGQLYPISPASVELDEGSLSVFW